MEKAELKTFLDNLVKKYETTDFIPHDPVQFPHKFNDQKDIEISGLLSSCLAYGKREKIIHSVDIIHKIMNYEPYCYIKSFDTYKHTRYFENFVHRYTGGRDIVLLFHILNRVYEEYGTLENLFLKGYSEDSCNIRNALSKFVKELKNNLPPGEENLRGINFLLPSPDKGSACKRLNLFLKWMVRKGPVDLNIWKSVSSEKLIIPLDTHVAKLSRKLELTQRKADDWITAEEITDNLKEFDPSDPVKYDFAIFGMGVSGEAKHLLS